MTADKTPESLAVRLGTVREWLQVQGPELAKVLRPHGMSEEAFLRDIGTVCARNPRLADCTRSSLMLSVMEAASLGLGLNTIGLAYLVPYRQTATLIIGYKGYVQLAGRGGTTIMADLVYENEPHRATQREPDRYHVKLPPAERGQEVIAAYAVGSPRGVPPHAKPAVWLWREDLDAHRARSRSWQEWSKDNTKSTPWITDPEPMMRKTAIRVLFPFLPLSAMIQRALAVDDADPEVAAVVDQVALAEAVAEAPDPMGKLAEALEAEKA